MFGVVFQFSCEREGKSCGYFLFWPEGECVGRCVWASEKDKANCIFMLILLFEGSVPVFTVYIARHQETIMVITATAWPCLYRNSDSSWCALLLPHTHTHTYRQTRTLTPPLSLPPWAAAVGVFWLVTWLSFLTLVAAVENSCCSSVFCFFLLKCHSFFYYFLYL